MNFKKLCFLFFVFLFSYNITYAFTLKTASQHSPPKYFKIQNNKVAGICIDIIHAIEKFNPNIHFIGYNKFLPFKRLQIYLENGKIDIFFGMRKTLRREKKYFFINVPLYKLNYVLVARRNDNISIESIENIEKLKNKGTILSIFGTAASKFLHSINGLKIDDTAKSPSQLLKMLLYKRGRFAFYHDLGLKYSINKLHLKNKVEILPKSFLSYNHYAAVSKKIPLKKIIIVKNTLRILESKGILKNIYQKYYNINSFTK